MRTIRRASCAISTTSGLLSPRLTLAHCTWARPEELELLAERGAIISANASSNLSLRSGIAPVAEMIKRGCRVALGLDGATLDEDDDALRELRLSHLLHGGTGFRIDVSRTATLARVLRTGRVSVLNRDDGGRLAAASPPTCCCSTGTRSTTIDCGPTSIRSI